MGTALATLLFAGAPLAAQAEHRAAEAAGEPLELVNGLWFDGGGFEARTVFVVAGRFESERPDAPTRTLDLAGGYVVSPFGEAHNHNVYDGADAALARYLAEGVLYVKNPNSLPRMTSTIRERVNRPDSIDVTFAGGGVTSSGGHPIPIAERNIERGTWIAGDGEGGFFHVLDAPTELERVWREVRAVPRDFLKVFLLYSEEHAARAADPQSYGWRGLDPALLPELVRRAHEAGWRVSCHVETAHDFHHALGAGVDEINHLPGFRVLEGYAPSTYAIAEDDARLAGERRTVVVTTLGGTLRLAETIAADDSARAATDQMLDVIRENLRRLQRHGARIAIGSDEFDLDEGTVVDEYLALERLGALEPEVLLRAWCETTAQTIFPERRLGRLEPGYEASLLVLGGDPLAEPERVRDVRLRMKQGRLLD